MKLSLIDNANGLTLASDDALGLNKMYLGIDAEHCLHSGGELLLTGGKLADCIGELVLRYLNVYVEGISTAHTVNNDLIVRGIAFLEKNCFDL